MSAVTPLIRMLCGASILAVLLWRIGAGPFIDGLHIVTPGSVFTAIGIGVLTTVCCAWRWKLVGRGLGLTVPLPRAIAAYYRSQFLNSTLPGGFIGDLDRGVRHGQNGGDIGLGLRTVGWERSAGQLVQLVVTVAVLAVLPSPLRSVLPAILAVVAGVLAVLAILAFALRRGAGRVGRLIRAAVSDVRRGLLPRRVWPGVALASVIVVLGHTATFLVAARTSGSTAAMAELLPLAVLALLAMSVPVGIGGWGPREGVAAGAFAAAGLGAGLGVTTAVVYGVLALAASLPGAVILLATAVTRRARGTSAVGVVLRSPTAVVAVTGAGRG